MIAALWRALTGFRRTREWRQFRLLARDSIRQLLNAATVSNSGDPMIFGIWVVVVVATPPTLYAVRGLIRYAAAPPAALPAVIVNDRMFFLLYAMLAAALLAALTWEALFPNHADQEALGALPVRPRTAAASRLAAGAGLSLALSAAISVPSGVIFGFISLMAPTLGFAPLVTIAHIVAICSGALFVFTTLLVLRTVAALLLGQHAADRLALGLQLVAVVAMLEVFFYLPVVLPFLVRQLAGGDWAMFLPPVWFASLQASMAGTADPSRNVHAVWALGALPLALVVATMMYLVPARLMARRALESQSRRRAGRLAPLAHTTSRLLRLEPVVASVFEFTIASFVRSPRHLLVAATYLGAGIGIGAVAAITAELRGALSPAPQTMTLSLPLVVMFFVTLGCRAAFKIPTDLSANWAFRLLPPATEHAASGARLAVVVLAILPLSALTMLLAATAGWEWLDVVSVGLFDVLAGVLLVECAFFGSTRIPFACAHEPDAETARSRWLIGFVALNIFAFRGADLQLLALASPLRTAAYVLLMLTVIAIVGYASRRESRRHTIDFDETEPRLQTLNLSEATQ